MTYVFDDLSLFDIHSGDGPREGTAYIELHAGELPEDHACWLPGSIIIRDAAFDFVTDCFYSAHPAYDYFDFVRFETSHIQALRTELSGLLATLRPGASRDQVFAKYTSLFSAEIWKDVPTDALRDRVAREIIEIESFAAKAEEDFGILWVLGM